MSVFLGQVTVEQVSPTIVEFGHGDIGARAIKYQDSVFYCFVALDDAEGVGSTAPERMKGKEPSVVLSFPADSVDSLDILITGLQNLRDRHYPGAEQKFTREMNFFTKVQ